MSKLFILGAGFSKALHNGMPLLNDLTRNLNWDSLAGARPEHRRLGNDVEQLLSYLYQEMPWKSLEERHLDLALFYAISRQIADYITQCEIQAFEETLPDWAMKFVEYLHRSQTTVVTLNYDTALERLTGKLDRGIVGSRDPESSERIERDLVLDDIYRLAMLPLEDRTKNPLGKHATPTYRLLKPHGSINWYALDDDPSGGQVFYSGISGFYPDTEESSRQQNIARHQLRESNKRDLVPLIIPPVAEKSTFYRSHLVKTLWSDFAQAIKTATQIYFVGYSLPKSDLSIRLFLMALLGESGKDIFIVNRNGTAELKENYESVLDGCNIQNMYLGEPNAVELMVNDLGQEFDDKLKVAHEVALQSGWLLQCAQCNSYAIASSNNFDHKAAREHTRNSVRQLIQSDDVRVRLFNGDENELLLLIGELDLNRGYSFSCACGAIKI